MKKYLTNPTARAFLLSNLLCCPFWGIFDLLPVLLCKELGATPLQITAIVALKPLTAVLAFYWGGMWHQRRLIPSLIAAYVLKFLPFLFIPFFSNPWIFIGAFAVHMLFLRGAIPPWMEVLKLNEPQVDSGKVCSIGLIINYISNAALPILFGWLLDRSEGVWRWIFVLTSIIGLVSVWFIFKIPRKEGSIQEEVKSTIAKPLKDLFRILRERPDFFRFQVGFFLGGAGLMVMHPVLPKYLTGNLNLSYVQIVFAMALCKGLGFVISSPLWVKLFKRMEIFHFCSRIPLLAAFFPAILLLSQLHVGFVFLAYFLYGVMQGGSELGWKMSGPVFSKEENSAPYSSINVFAVGVRGGIFPYLGAFLFLYGGVYTPLICGGLLCLAASLHFWQSAKGVSGAKKSLQGSQ